MTTPGRPVLTGEQRSGARIAAWSLLAVTVLAIPANALLSANRTWVVPAALAFIVVGLLDVVVGWGLWRLLRARSAGPAWASLLTRAGYGLVLVGLAVGLLAGRDAAWFTQWWTVWLALFGLHLLVTAWGLRAGCRAPWLVVVATAAGGLAYLVDALPDAWQVIPGAVLVPFMMAELVLLVWLFLVARRR